MQKTHGFPYNYNEYIYKQFVGKDSYLAAMQGLQSIV
jgi:hypothetical protein